MLHSSYINPRAFFVKISSSYPISRTKTGSEGEKVTNNLYKTSGKWSILPQFLVKICDRQIETDRVLIMPKLIKVCDMEYL